MPNITQILAKIDQIKRNTAKNLQDPLGAIGLGLLRADEEFKQDPVNTVLGSANIGGGLLGMTKAVKLPKAPQADALETARRNAVKMLGLPENNTPMDRARALGFDTPAYHGTSKSFDAFDLNRAGQTTDSGDYGRSVYSSPSAQVASDYAASVEGSNVMPLMINKGRSLSVDDYVNIPLKDFPYSSVYNNPDVVSDFVKSKGFDSVSEKGDVVDQYAVFNPSRIRSRFAAFDPARVNENNLLASRLLPFAVPGLLGAYGMDNE